MIENLIAARWAMHETFHNAQAALVLRRLAAGQPALLDYNDQKQAHVPTLANPQAGHIGVDGKYKAWDIAGAKGGQVAIIPIIGTMSRYGDFCSYGSEDYANWIMEANAADYINAIVLEINSPGGQVDGTELLGAVVAQSKKPIVAYVTGMAASAAYWVASQCDKIVMESDVTSEVGSIGVLAMHVDMSQFYEDQGLKIKILRSEGSQDKALFNSVEPLTPDLEASIRTELNVIRARFIDTVKAGRPGISDKVFTGKMYTGKDALKLDMADKIGYLGDAVYLADLLARKSA
jgi:protease IV